MTKKDFPVALSLSDVIRLRDLVYDGDNSHNYNNGSLSVFSTGCATKSPKPSPPPPLKMNLSLIHDGNWEVGKEDTIVFKFAPLEDVEHRTEYPDEGIFDPVSSLTLISGDPYWSGFLEKGKEYSIAVVLKPTKRGKFYIQGSVRSGQNKIYSDVELKMLKKRYAKWIEPNKQYSNRGVKVLFPTKDFNYYNSKWEVLQVKGTESDPIDTTMNEIDAALIRRGNFGPLPLDFKIEVIKDSTKIAYPPQPK